MISDNYRRQLEALHAQEPRWGTTAHKYAGRIAEIIETMGAKTILDYGCGKGTLATSLAGLPYKISEYDPGIPGKSSLPKHPCDLLVSCDVLEHIEPEAIDATLEEMRAYCTRASFHVIALYDVNRKLPDGRSVHLIVESKEWWQERLAKAYPGWKMQEYPGLPSPEIIDHTGRVRPKKPCYVVLLTKEN